MSDSFEDKKMQNNEIDLLDLFRRIGNTIKKWINGIGKAILISIVFLVRKWLPLGIVLSLAIFCSFLFKFTSDSSYTSDLVLKNNLGSNSDLIDYINKLHKFCIEKNRIGLSNALNLDSGKVENILDISAYWIIDKGKDGIPDEVDYSDSHNVYDTINLRMQDRLDIKVTIIEPQELLLLRNSIIKYISSDSLFLQLNRFRLRQNDDFLKRIEHDIAMLDSLQKVKYFEEARNFSPKLGGQTIFLQEQKTQLIYSDIYTLFDKKQYYESQRVLYKDLVTVISDFPQPNKRINGGLFYAREIVPIAFLVTLLILVLIENRKKLKDIYTKYK
jgi:hypothetical protein